MIDADRLDLHANTILKSNYDNPGILGHDRSEAVLVYQPGVRVIIKAVLDENVLLRKAWYPLKTSLLGRLTRLQLRVPQQVLHYKSWQVNHIYT